MVAQALVLAQALVRNIETKQSCMTGLDDNQDIVHNPDIVHNNLVLADQNIVRTTPGTGDPITTAENNRTWGSN